MTNEKATPTDVDRVIDIINMVQTIVSERDALLKERDDLKEANRNLGETLRNCLNPDHTACLIQSDEHREKIEKLEAELKKYKKI